MLNNVENQYNNWVYPDPIDDMQAAISKGNYLEIGDPLVYWPLMWPHKRSIDKLDILVAGCGTNQAAYYACRNPNWQVLGVDLSDSSLAHQQKLKKKHNLANLRLEKLDLIKINSLGLDFDFITSTGVLHHLPNPDEGLSALQSVLRSDGVMNLMVYGTSLRLGVYMMQEVFQILGFKQIKEDVNITRETINSLYQDHVLCRYLKFATDLNYDGAIVDTFLHPQDRSYSVKEIYEFTRKAKLEFLSWCDNMEYSLKGAIPDAHPLWQKINSINITDEDKHHIHDLLIQDRGTHRWLCAHPSYVEKCKINFEGSEYLTYSIYLHRTAKVIKGSDLIKKNNALIVRTNGSVHYQFQLSYNLSIIIKSIANGNESVGIAIEKLNLKDRDTPNLIQELRAEIKSLYECGHVYVLLPEEK